MKNGQFQSVSNNSIIHQIRPRCEIGQRQPRVIFEQIMMGPSGQCFIPSFTAIDPLVPEKKIFERFLPYMGMAAILVK